MSYHDKQQPPGSPLAETLSEAALRRYLAADIATALLQPNCPPRLLFEAFAQLASARYTISTYLPRHLVAHCLATDNNGPWLEWVDGSLLFADVSGSTALAERLTNLGHEGSEIVTGTLNTFFDTMIRIIEAAGGDLLTFGGDALLVLFQGPGHAHIATRTALDLLQICGNDAQGQARFQRTVPGVGTFSLYIHIGVESGRVALVSAGQADSLRYSAIGSVVNRVARAESYGNRSELVVGPQTWSSIAPDACGIALEAGYVRVETLAVAHLPPAPLPTLDLITTPSLQSIPLLIHQLDRISPYLPDNLLNRILVDPQRPRIEADLRPVTVLFAQILGLANLVEYLDPDHAARVFDVLLWPIQTAIKSYGGILNKLDLAEEGDKLLAIFGAPVAFEDHAERAARAALAMFATDILHHATIQALPPNLLPSIQMRIGLNTGSVFAGNVGNETRKEYTVMGDAVNVAARVMTRTPWSEIWCSAATARRISQRVVCDDRGHVTVKGKAEPIQVLRLIGQRATPFDLHAVDGPLVGRHQELAWLSDHLVATHAGHGRVVRICGDAGIGKSHLSAALLEQAYELDMRVIGVTCLSYATNIPFAPWAEWLKSLCAIEASDPPPVRIDKLTARLDGIEEHVTDWLPLLAELIRVEMPDNRLTRPLEPQQRQARRFELLTALLRATALEQSLLYAGTDQPNASNQSPPGLLVLFDDLHWADPASLDLWQYMAARIDDIPVLLLGVHRPQLTWDSTPLDLYAHTVTRDSSRTSDADDADDTEQHTTTPDQAFVLQLDELPLQDCEALIQTRLGDHPLSSDLRRKIVARAGGNPLFLKELLLSVTTDEQQLVLGDPDALDQAMSHTLDDLPDSLRELLLARIDRLDESSRALLRIASVIGQRFPFGVLQSLHPNDQRSLLLQLSNLDAQEFTLLEREFPERVHLFRHTLLQEVAYQSLLYARRRELHGQIGTYLEKRHAADLKPYYGLLAHHYRLSDNHEKAITYLLLAGHDACDDYANDEAIQYYRWALEFLGDTPMHAAYCEAHKALGDVLYTVGQYDEALDTYAAILEDDGGEAALSPAIVAEVLRCRGNALEKQGRYADAMAALQQAEATIQDDPEALASLLLAAIYGDMGLVLMRQGAYDQALYICDMGLQRLDRHEHSDEYAAIETDLHIQLGTIYGMRGNYNTAREHFAHALAVQEARTDLYGSSRSHNNIGYLWQLQGDYLQAIEQYALAEQTARHISAKYILSSAQLNMAYAYYCLGRYDQAEVQCQAAMTLCEEMRDQSGIAHGYDLSGMIAYNRGDYQQALAAYDQALALYRDMGSSFQEGNTLDNMANVHNALFQPGRARELSYQACKIAERIQSPQLKIEVLNTLAEADLLYFHTTGDSTALSDCVARLEQASSLALELGSKRDYGVAQRLLGQAASYQSQSADAFFRTAMLTFEEIKNRFELARTQIRYAETLADTHTDLASAYLKQAQQTFNEIGAGGELARFADLLERSA